MALTGQNIGRYHILEQLGQGGMATVYKAFDTRLERDVAVKIIRTDAFAPAILDRLLQRFEHEAKSLARMSHPAIVKVHDYGEYQGAPYLVIELLAGGTLKDQLDQPVSFPTAVRLILPIARALDYAHRRGVLHRDVKPGNILFSDEGETILTDFGIAKLLENEKGQTITGTGVGVGTPEYMAPEQGLGKEIDGRADIYALGIVFYELITGQKPYTADTPLAVLLMQVNEPLPRPRNFVKDLPEEVERVLFKALAKNPDDRYENMAAFSTALEMLMRLIPNSIPIPKPIPNATTYQTAILDERQETFDNLDSTTPDPLPDSRPNQSRTPIKIQETNGKLKPAAPDPKPQDKVNKTHISNWLKWVGGGSIGLILMMVLVFDFILPNIVRGNETIGTGSIVSEQITPVETVSIEPTSHLLPVVNDNTPTSMYTNTPNNISSPIFKGPPDICNTDEFGCAVIPPGSTIKLGMGAPISGDYASFGIDISQGAVIAIKDAGKFEGLKFELEVQDTKGTPGGGAEVANKFATDPTIVAVPGHIFSGSTEAAIPVYEKAGIPILSPSATNPTLTTLGSKVFNRIAFTDAVQGQFAADYLYNKLGFRKIAVVHDGGAYGQGLADVVKSEFEKLGGEVVGYEAITPGEVDYTATLSVLASKNPEALYFGGYVAEGVLLTNQMKQTGLENAVFFGCDGTFGAEFVEKTGANGEGAYSASVIPPESEAKVKFDATYLTDYGVLAGSLSPYTWSGYDATAALIAIVKEVALKSSDGTLYIPRGVLINAVRTMKNFEGITGIISCNEIGECNTSGPTFYIVQNGNWVVVTK